MKLYTFFRSGTSHRLRIALNLKGVHYDQVAIDLRKEEHLDEAYKAINPQQLVPALDIGDGLLTQSPAIIEWLEERYPTPALLPTDALERAQVRALAAIVGCDIHPVNNRRILEALRHRFSADEAAIDDWCASWIVAGFDAFEALVRGYGRGPFSFGAQRRWPTSTSCPRSKARAASRSTWHAGRGWSRSMPRAASSTLSAAPPRRSSPTLPDRLR